MSNVIIGALPEDYLVQVQGAQLISNLGINTVTNISTPPASQWSFVKYISHYVYGDRVYSLGMFFSKLLSIESSNGLYGYFYSVRTDTELLYICPLPRMDIANGDGNGVIYMDNGKLAIAVTNGYMVRVSMITGDLESTYPKVRIPVVQWYRDIDGITQVPYITMVYKNDRIYISGVHDRRTYLGVLDGMSGNTIYDRLLSSGDEATDTLIIACMEVSDILYLGGSYSRGTTDTGALLMITTLDGAPINIQTSRYTSAGNMDGTPAGGTGVDIITGIKRGSDGDVYIIGMMSPGTSKFLGNELTVSSNTIRALTVAPTLKITTQQTWMSPDGLPLLPRLRVTVSTLQVLVGTTLYQLDRKWSLIKSIKTVGLSDMIISNGNARWLVLSGYHYSGNVIVGDDYIQVSNNAPVLITIKQIQL